MRVKYEKFNGSLGEFCEMYLNGGVFYIMEHGFAKEVGINISSSLLLEHYGMTVYTKSEPKWYENLGEGVLCWVWDRGDKTIAIVENYKSDVNYKYIDTNSEGWENAEPLTKEEVLKYIWEGGL